LFPGLLGLWLTLALLKFGNPVILDSQIAAPTSWGEAIFQSWPVTWGHFLFAAVFLCGCLALKRPVIDSRRWLLIVLPLGWLAWQGLAASRTVRPDLTQVTISHFIICVASFYLGLFVLASSRPLRMFWLAVGAGWWAMILIGWRQHFGGLAETREFLYSLPNWRELSPELIAKVASNRIFSTLFYPNTLAGALLLYTPAILAVSWTVAQGRPWGIYLRLGFCAAPGVGAAACMLWSGSKAGWLIATAMIAVAFARRLLFKPNVPETAAPGPDQDKSGSRSQSDSRSRGSRANSRGSRRMVQAGLVVCLVILVGAGGFWLRHRDYFARGATSVSARFTYWSVAVSNSLAQPILGSGPGTFVEVYRRGKPPEAEMTRLVHNDYLQQATDSGLGAGILFVALVGGALIVGWPGRTGNPVRFGVWLGVAGLAAQSLVEFGLYIPALAWPWFIAMGALLGISSPVGMRKNLRQAGVRSPSLRA
jgi:hypothetical protein